MLVRLFGFALFVIFSLSTLKGIVFSQEMNGSNSEYSLDACGGVQFSRWIEELTFLKNPDILEQRRNSTEKRFALSGNRTFGDQDTLAVVSRLGNKTQCLYIQRFSSCYEEGFNRLTSALPFFQTENHSEIRLRSDLLKISTDRFSEIEISYIVSENKDGTLDFKMIEDQFRLNESLSGAWTGDAIDVSDALISQVLPEKIYCSIAFISDEEIIDSENEILYFINQSWIRQNGEDAPRQSEQQGASIDHLPLSYEIRIVNQDGRKTAFWRAGPDEREPRYYLVVEAIGSGGAVMQLPILNEESGKSETVSVWGLRVPEATYKSVEADKKDDGVLQRNIVGLKESGSLEMRYLMPVLGGAVTEWGESEGSRTVEAEDNRLENELSWRVRQCINMPPGAEEMGAVATVEFGVDNQGQVIEQPVVLSSTDDVYARAVSRAILRCGPYSEFSGETVRAKFNARDL